MFENMPQKRHCCYIVPLRHASVMISSVGLLIGGLGCMLSARYALANQRLRGTDLTMEEAMKKYTLFAAGTFSFMTIVASTMLFLGGAFRQTKYICWYIYIIMAMCMGMVIVSVVVPLSCFCKPEKPCILRSVSFTTTTLIYLAVTVWMQVWIYFALVASNLMKHMMYGKARK